MSSLTHHKTFHLKADKKQARIFKYDDYFLEVGNSDLRLQLNNEKGSIDSNFGMRHSYFDCQGQTDPSVVLGTKEKQMNVSCYEVFQLLLE